VLWQGGHHRRRGDFGDLCAYHAAYCDSIGVAHETAHCKSNNAPTLGVSDSAIVCSYGDSHLQSLCRPFLCSVLDTDAVAYDSSSHTLSIRKAFSSTYDAPRRSNSPADIYANNAQRHSYSRAIISPHTAQFLLVVPGQRHQH